MEDFSVDPQSNRDVRVSVPSEYSIRLSGNSSINKVHSAGGRRRTGVDGGQMGTNGGKWG